LLDHRFTTVAFSQIMPFSWLVFSQHLLHFSFSFEFRLTMLGVKSPDPLFPFIA
jgi:hypothetical protein